MGKQKRDASNEKPTNEAKKSKTESSPSETPEKAGSTIVSKGEYKWKIISWNINGIRAWKEKDGLSIFEKESPDIVCLQETKCSKAKIPSDVKIKGYQSYFMSAKKEGYAGVGLFSKQEPLSIVYGLGDSEHDDEGRCITAEYDEFYVVTSYVPNSGRKLVTLDKRMDWEPKMREHISKLDKKKPVVYCGDLNVAHKEIDLANPKTNKRNAGFTDEERNCFTELLSAGFIDSFRTLYPERTKAYTFWTYMMNARAKNVGWRLDYFVLSNRLEERLVDSEILSTIMGSDHCPIYLLLK